MKKFVSILLALIIVLTPCTAFAEWQDDIISCYVADAGGQMFIRVALNEKYKTFADDINIMVSGQESNSFLVCNKSVLKCVKEKSRDNYEPETLVIYISCDELIDENENIKIYIPENSVFDSKGNGNGKLTSETYNKVNNFYECCFNIEFKDKTCKYTPGKTVTYTSSFPVDYYVNNTLVSENSFDYDFTIESHGKYKVEAKKFGVTLGTDEFDTEVTKKENLESTSKRLLGLLGLSAISPLLFVLSPLLAFLPPLMAAALAAPFEAFSESFTAIKDLIYLLTH